MTQQKRGLKCGWHEQTIVTASSAIHTVYIWNPVPMKSHFPPKSCSVSFHINNGISTISTGAGFLPSTVCLSVFWTNLSRQRRCLSWAWRKLFLDRWCWCVDASGLMNLHTSSLRLVVKLDHLHQILQATFSKNDSSLCVRPPSYQTAASDLDTQKKTL